MVLGRATRKGNALRWETLEQISPGNPEGDSPLILYNGLLRLEKPNEK